MKYKLGLTVAVLLATQIASCGGGYLLVKDPASGNVYYTTEVDDAGNSGAVKFKDAKTGNIVTLQSSEVRQITKEEFRTNTGNW
jgi:hypothetical protein